MKRSASDSTLFSSETLATNRSADTWNEYNNLPFSITPDKISIDLNSNQIFQVTFTPVDVFDYTIQLKGSVENKEPQLKDIEIEVKARSILPIYCFELEASDYVIARRRGRKICNDLFDENTKIIEFESIGIGNISTKYK